MGLALYSGAESGASDRVSGWAISAGRRRLSMRVTNFSQERARAEVRQSDCRRSGCTRQVGGFFTGRLFLRLRGGSAQFRPLNVGFRFVCSR